MKVGGGGKDIMEYKQFDSMTLREITELIRVLMRIRSKRIEEQCSRVKIGQPEKDEVKHE